MYLALQSGLMSSVSSTAGVTQYDNVETQTGALAPSTSALSPEAGIQAHTHSCIAPKVDPLEGQMCTFLSSSRPHGVLLRLLACQP